MIILDAFVLSHTSEVVDFPDQDKVDQFLPPYDPEYRVHPSDPHTFGGLTAPDRYYELRYKIEQAMQKAKGLFEETGREFEELFGRYYGMVESYRLDDAETVIVSSATVAGTARVAVDMLRERGEKVGLLRIRVFRPFPIETVQNALEKASKVIVIDRNISFGHSGIFFSELKSALYNEPHHPPILGYIAGLGGRDVTPETITGIYEDAAAKDRPEAPIAWIGAKL
jgi:pyruvate ferredoxin oxidoreductase alpha subunit